MPIETNDEDIYSWLTEELGWSPQDAYSELTGAGDEDATEYRAPEGPQEYSTDPIQSAKAAILANEAMKREEASLEARWREAGRQGFTPAQASFVNQNNHYGQVMPTSRGFMYIGAPPAVEAPNAGYDRMQAMGGFVQPPESDESMFVRARANDIPGVSRTISVRSDVPMPIPSPAEQQFEAQQRYQTVLRETGDVRRALEAAGPGVVSGLASRAMLTPWQQVQARHYQNMDELNQKRLSIVPPAGTTSTATNRDLDYQIRSEKSFIREQEGKQIGLTPDSQEYLDRQRLITKHIRILNDLEAKRQGGTATAAPAPTPVSVAAPRKTLDRNTALEFLKQAKGNRDKARQLAAAAGYSF